MNQILMKGSVPTGDTIIASLHCFQFQLNSSTIDELGEWCLERRVRPRMKPSQTRTVSMTTL